MNGMFEVRAAHRQMANYTIIFTLTGSTIVPSHVHTTYGFRFIWHASRDGCRVVPFTELIGPRKLLLAVVRINLSWVSDRYFTPIAQ